MQTCLVMGPSTMGSLRGDWIIHEEDEFADLKASARGSGTTYDFRGDMGAGESHFCTRPSLC